MTRSLDSAIRCKQGANETLTKHEWRFSALPTTFTSYGGSFFFSGVLEQEVRACTKDGKSVDLSQPDVKEGIVEKISNEAMARFFLYSLNDA